MVFIFVNFESREENRGSRIKNRGSKTPLIDFISMNLGEKQRL